MNLANLLLKGPDRPVPCGSGCLDYTGLSPESTKMLIEIMASIGKANVIKS